MIIGYHHQRWDSVSVYLFLATIKSSLILYLSAKAMAKVLVVPPSKCESLLKMLSFDF